MFLTIDVLLISDLAAKSFHASHTIYSMWLNTHVLCRGRLACNKLRKTQEPSSALTQYRPYKHAVLLDIACCDTVGTRWIRNICECRYTVKACVLFTIRIFLYRRRKWGFYLIEFCKQSLYLTLQSEQTSLGDQTSFMCTALKFCLPSAYKLNYCSEQ